MNIQRRKKLSHKDLAIYKQTLKLTDQQKEIIVGTLLGDSSISVRKGVPHYSIKFEQGEMHRGYVEHLYQVFEPYCGSSPSERFIDKNKTRKAVWFRTYSHIDIKFYFDLFYDYVPNASNAKK